MTVHVRSFYRRSTLAGRPQGTGQQRPIRAVHFPSVADIHRVRPWDSERSADPAKDRAGRLSLLDTPYVSSPREIAVLHRRYRLADPAQAWFVGLPPDTAKALAD